MPRWCVRTLIVLSLAMFATATALADPPAKIRLLILSGANNHSWKTTTPVLQKLYEDSGRFTVSVTNDVPALKPGDFSAYDCLVSNYTTYPKIEGQRLPAETEKALLDYVAAGHGFVLFHAASTAWNDWPEFTDFIALTWQKGKSGHGAAHSFIVTIADKQHPVTRGMKDFQHVRDELYHHQVKHATGRVLATAWSDPATRGSGENEPMVVVNQHGKGRMFHLALGHSAKSMDGIGFQTLMLRGTEWAATGDVTLPIPATWPTPGSAAAEQIKSESAAETAQADAVRKAKAAAKKVPAEAKK